MLKSRMREKRGRRRNVKKQRERDKIECKEERERERETSGKKDANSRSGEIKMSRVYPGTNTPSCGIRAAAGTGISEEPAALVPPPISCREPSSERSLCEVLSGSRIPACLLA